MTSAETRIVNDTRARVESIYDGYVNFHPWQNSPDNLAESWEVPGDDAVIDILVDIYKTPPAFVDKEIEEAYEEWGQSVAPLLGKALRENPAWVSRCRRWIHDSEVRLWLIQSVNLDAQFVLIDDLIPIVAALSQDEIDMVIAVLLWMDQRTGGDEGYRRMLELLKVVPVWYQPDPAHQEGRLPTWGERKTRQEK